MEEMFRKSIATTVLIGINLVVFFWLAWQQQSLMMDTGADALAILHVGGNFNPYTLGDQPWRLLTSMFLHYGVIHLAVNMYGLYVLGAGLEPAVGTRRFLLVYFCCGLVSGIASLLFNTYVISAGASGALFGLYGYRLGAEVIGSFHDRQQLRTVFINFVIFVLINAFITAQLNVDLAGHIGGCIAGVVLSAFHFKLRWLIPNGQLLVVMLAIPLVLFVLPQGQKRYYAIYQQVLRAEDDGGRVYGAAKTDEALKDSLELLAGEWDTIASQLRALPTIPAVLQADTAIIGQYSRLRYAETTYRIKMIARESYVYRDSIELIQQQQATIGKIRFPLNYDASLALTADTVQEVPAAAPPPGWDYTKVYYDKDWKETLSVTDYHYYREGARDSAGRWQGRVTDYFRNGDVQMKGEYKDGLKDGIFLYYSDHGTYTSAGRYTREESVGKWETYHNNGRLQREVVYQDGAFTRNVWDSLGRVQVKDGNGYETQWYENGQIKAVGSYLDGKQEGLWRGYHADGTPYYQELYHEGKLERGMAVTRDGKRYVYDQWSDLALPVMGLEKYRKYLDGHTHAPGALWPGSGTVKVVFTVDPRGRLRDFVILQSVCPVCDQEAIRLLREGPPWRPALVRGHLAVTAQGYMEVSF
jgi:membrane associated rhomboid family serine protease/antitoxin component YwqK of YwqJK toxin-antitoxin module